MRLVFFVIIIICFGINCFSQKLKYEGAKYRDPFKSYLPISLPEKKSLELKDFHLTGIVWGSGRPQAIINGKVLDVGDTILEAKVVRIEKKGVLLDYKGRLYLLSAPK